MVANIRTGATVGGAVRYNEEKANRDRPMPSIHPLDAVLELADVQTYEEQQQQIRKRKKRSMNRH